jgi:hypothetical protein
MRQPVRRSGGQAVRGLALLTLLLSAYRPNRLSSQTPPDTVAPAAAQDTSHRLKPFAAAWRSLLLPGWGQAALGRDVAGAVLASWEGVTMMMTLKARQELHYVEQSGSGNVQAKRQQAQDWLVLWIFNHLFAGAEAFVSAHLQDFPKELRMRALPGGVGVAIPIH